MPGGTTIVARVSNVVLVRSSDMLRTTPLAKGNATLPSAIERHVTTTWEAGHQIGGTAGSTKDLLEGVETEVGRSTGRGRKQ
jgi:hypothetical protein